MDSLIQLWWIESDLLSRFLEEGVFHDSFPAVQAFKSQNREIVWNSANNHLRRCSNVTCFPRLFCDIQNFYVQATNGAGKKRNCRWHQPWCPRSQILWRLQLKKRNLRYFGGIRKESNDNSFVVLKCSYHVTMMFGIITKSSLILLRISRLAVSFGNTGACFGRFQPAMILCANHPSSKTQRNTGVRSQSGTCQTTATVSSEQWTLRMIVLVGSRKL